MKCIFKLITVLLVSASICAIETDTPKMNTYNYENIFFYRPKLNEFKIDILGEFLYWKLSEEEVDFAITNAVDPGTTEAIGTLATAKFDWQPGFRIGLGINFPPDFFELNANYLYFSPSGNKSYTASSPSINFINDLLSTFVEHTNTTILKAKSHIDFSLQQGDILISKRFNPSNYTILKLQFGPSIAYLEQTWKINFLPRAGGVVNPVRENWRFIGGGLQVGGDFDFFFGKGFSLLATSSASLIYGQYKNRFTNKKGETTQSDVRLTDHHVINNIRFALGPCWGWQFSNWGINLQARYELGIWYNLHMVLRSLEDTLGNGRPSLHSNGPLSIQGVNVSAILNF